MNPTASINSRVVEVLHGDTILEAATRLGIAIPSPCHAPGLPSPESCRLCLVHSETHPHPLGACHTALEPGMELQTHHVGIEKWRASVLRLHVETGSHTGFRPGRLRNGKFRDLLSAYRVSWENTNVETARDDSHPMLRFDPAACVSCRLCVSACNTVAHRFALQVRGRGATTGVAPLAGRPLFDTPCTACGACSELCPTGALQDRVPSADPNLEINSTDSVCSYCSVGCRIQVHTAGEDVVRVTGIADRSATNPGGALCQKARHGYLHQQSWDRLTKPMIRHGAGFRQVTWTEALDYIEEKWREIHQAHGPGSFAAIASTRATTEANYLLQKLCRAVIGSPHIDSAVRLCQPPGSAATIATAGFADIDQAACLVIAGADPDTSHPVLAARIRQAAAAGAALIVIDPRRTELADFADRHLRPQPGTEADRLLFLALAEAVSAREAGAESLPESATAAAISAGFAASDFEDAAELLSRHRGGTLFLAGTGLTQRPGGEQILAAYFDLARRTGNLEGPGAGYLPVGGQNNLTGCLEAGCAPEILPAQGKIDDPAARARVESAWGCTLPEGDGLSVNGMIAAAAAGELRALWVMGHDVAQAQAGSIQATEALKKLDLLVVQDLFYHETSRHAHVLLPAASPFEQTGVYFNAERRAQLARGALPPAEESRPDWAILTVVARRLGCDWPYQEPAHVFAELAALAPERFGALSHKRLDETPEGIRCPAPLATKIEAEVKGGESKTEIDPAYPFILMTGRRIEHHGTGSMSRRDPARKLTDRDRVWLNPIDAAGLGIAAGERVKIESAAGSTTVEAGISDRLGRGTVFLTIHFPQTGANRLIAPASETRASPAFKATPVRILKS
jgi:formate dehydrogenase major subunit